MPEGLVAQLNAVHWFSELAAKPLWGSASPAYGFAGLGLVPPPACRTLLQVHGTAIVDASSLKEGAASVAGDGLYLVDCPGSIAVRTADCLPILLAAPSHRFVMALHAGWRGLSAGIIAEALACIQRLQIPLRSLHVVTGPVISPGRFEVGPEVVAAFAAAAFGLSEAQVGFCLQKGAHDRWHVDLSQCAVLAFLNQGLAPQQLAVLRSCTFEQPSLWPSYRRDGKTTPAILSWLSQS